MARLIREHRSALSYLPVLCCQPSTLTNTSLSLLSYSLPFSQLLL
ncbi:unnamed protein product [Oppiella nova]|uniref:Uncharacterized protein n=1 Tax=Oppiella nova TaxID=334625 RepID=A0A7R9R0F2_9ACAR|nr:unnamed protein product [Oppiella nova]CAG2181160.1 unnamed protein product [Oppiella nova]